MYCLNNNNDDGDDDDDDDDDNNNNNNNNNINNNNSNSNRMNQPRICFLDLGLNVFRFQYCALIVEKNNSTSLF